MALKRTGFKKKRSTPLRQATPLKRFSQLRSKTPMKKKRSTPRKKNPIFVDEAYLDTLRKMSCCACGRTPIVDDGECTDPHHLKARGYADAFRDDRICVPLCRFCHTECHGGLEKFDKKYNISCWAIAKKLWNAWEKLKEKAMEKQESSTKEKTETVKQVGTTTVTTSEKDGKTTQTAQMNVTSNSARIPNEK